MSDSGQWAMQCIVHVRASRSELYACTLWQGVRDKTYIKRSNTALGKIGLGEIDREKG